MIPLGNYASVSEDATLFEAIVALEEAQKGVGQGRDPHRAVLVLDKHQRVVGKVDPWDVIKGIEPRYKGLSAPREISCPDSSPRCFSAMMDTYGLWRESLDNLCRKAAELNVRDIMHFPANGEHIDQDALLHEAINRLILGHHQSLLVTRGGEEIVGILRLSDVFKEIRDRIRTCRV